MRRIVSALLLALVMVGPGVRAAGAVSIDDLMNLRANGLSDEVLIALIRSDASEFHLTADDVLALHRRGAGDRLIAAMLETARPRIDGRDAIQREDSQPRPDAESGDHSRPAVYHETRQAPSVVVNQSVAVDVQPAVAPQTVVVAVPVAVVVPVKPVEPVYWGFGGRLRPGSWRPQ
jgi:hypothetical protein